MNKITTKVEEVEKHLQFTIVLAMFFPVLVEALFSLGETGAESISRTTLGLGASISSLIISYVLFELRKNNFTGRMLSYLNWIFLVTIICYAFVFLSVSLRPSVSTPLGSVLVYYLLPVMFYGSKYVPMASFAIIILDFFIKKSETI